MEQQPLVSIGVPVYNGAKYLEECLNSILVQTYQNWECVIIDNCSKDDTNIIAEKFEEIDKRFRVIKNKDFVDQTTNWNISFSAISAEAIYFKIVCADDWIYPEHIEKMVAVMEKYPSTGICSSYRIDGQAVNCDKLNFYEGPFRNGKEILIKQLFYQLDVTGSVNTVLYRIDTLKHIKNYPQLFRPNTYHIDTELAFEVLSIADLGFVFQVLSYTRRHNETYTSQISNRFMTGLYFREKELFKYQKLQSGLDTEYNNVRNHYAFFMLKQHLKGDKECIAWHRKYMDKSRHFTTKDYIKAILFRLKSKLF